MSAALKKYKANGTVTVAWGNITLSYKGSADPVVFSVNGTDLTNTTSITFDVPFGRLILINVSGTSFSIKYAGFSNPHGMVPNNMLWNLPDTLYFETDSVTVPGSILAPWATALLQNGALNGTLVAWALTAPSFEFHWYPFTNSALLTGH
jgi:choice-of-anchor A domain-containing protein